MVAVAWWLLSVSCEGMTECFRLIPEDPKGLHMRSEATHEDFFLRFVFGSRDEWMRHPAMKMNRGESNDRNQNVYPKRLKPSRPDLPSSPFCSTYLHARLIRQLTFGLIRGNPEGQSVPRNKKGQNDNRSAEGTRPEEIGWQRNAGTVIDSRRCTRKMVRASEWLIVLPSDLHLIFSPVLHFHGTLHNSTWLTSVSVLPRTPYPAPHQ